MGKDLQSLGKDLGRLWDNIDTVKNSHEQAAKGKGGVASKALDTYLATVKARDLEDELRRIIMETRGNSGWKELQAIRQQVMKADREGRAAALARKHQIQHVVSIILGLTFLAAAVFALGYMVVYLQDA